jgi:hypothetical protein
VTLIVNRRVLFRNNHFPVMNFEVLYIGFYLRAVQTTTLQMVIVPKCFINSQLFEIKGVFYNDSTNSWHFFFLRSSQKSDQNCMIGRVSNKKLYSVLTNLDL